jgi:hypothetical protein
MFFEDLAVINESLFQGQSNWLGNSSEAVEESKE